MSTAVIEYQWRGYIPPGDGEAWSVEATISHAAGVIASTGKELLANLREELEEAGLRKIGASIINKYSNRARPSQWFPRWREVWKHKDEIVVDHFELSPRAQKAKFEAAGTRRGYNPTLARTTSLLILQHPTRGSVEYQHDFEGWVRRTLPAYSLNRKRGWFEAKLTEANYEAIMATDQELNISDGAREWYAKKGDERMKGEEKLLEMVHKAKDRFPELHSRALNAAEIVRAGKVERTGYGLFEVQSQNGEETYTIDTEARTCTCPDHLGLYKSKAPEINGAPLCKHRIACLMYLKLHEKAPAKATLDPQREMRMVEAQVAAAKAGQLVALVL